MNSRLLLRLKQAAACGIGVANIHAFAQQLPLFQPVHGMKLEYALRTLPLSANMTNPQPQTRGRTHLIGNQTCIELSSAVMSRLTLLDTMAHILCKTPALNQAVLLVDEQQAANEIAKAALRPRFSAAAELSARGTPSSNSGAGVLNSSATGSIGLTWVLFDAGARTAAVEQSRQVLKSAQANQQVAALAALNEALRLYIEASTAFARLSALRETEETARQSEAAAQAKYEAFVVSLSEKLQAQTALAQATLDRVRGEGTWDTARVALTLAMGLPVNQDLQLASIGQAFPAATSAQTAGLGDAALSEHPRIMAARADVMALKSRLDIVRADARGTVALAASVASTKDLSASGYGFQGNLSGNLLARIPLFNGDEQRAREAQVMAQILRQEENIIQIERDLSLETSRNQRLLETEKQNLLAARLLFNAASQSYAITIGRYKAGVGSILELLATQSALSNARSQLAQAEITQAQARLRLDVAAGKIIFSK